MIRHTFTILILAAGVSRAADDLTPLDVKSGLWETTSTTERGGMPTIPAEQLAKMPAAARARLQGMSAPSTDTRQSCLTKEEVSKFGLNKDKSCKVTTVTSTGSKQEFKFDCDTAGSKSTGSMKIEAADATHVNGLVLINMNAGGRVMDMKVTTSAKWLSDSCGDVKPNGKQE
jgi:hypothetical protein